MPFDAATLSLVEDALSDGFRYHYALDSFLTRSGLGLDVLARIRSRAEVRALQGGRFTKAPKRFVVQEALRELSTMSADGDRIVAALITALTQVALPDAQPNAIEAVKNLKTKTEADVQTNRERRRTERDRQRRDARSQERVRELERANAASKRDALKQRFEGLLAEQNAQARGYLLETFLLDMLDHYAFDPRRSFRLVGEQIDGSFSWRSKTYLVEAKWVKTPVAGAEFGAFSYKLEGKTVDTRGLYISINGYSPEAIKGMNSKGALKFVCIDGAHIMRALISDGGLDDVLQRVWRHADETGESYLPVSLI